MQFSFSLVSIILLLGAAQGIFIAFLLLSKKGNKTANRFLAFLMISYSAFIAESSLSGTPIAEQFPHLLGLAAGIVFLIGPLHYLYSISLMSPGFAFSKKHLLHLIPFLCFYLFFLFPYYLQSGEYKIQFIILLEEQGSTPELIFFNWVAIFQGVIYMSVTLILLFKHSSKIKDSFSSVEKINLTWLRNITTMSTALWSLGLIIKFLQIFGLATTVEPAVPISTALLIYAMGYLGLKQHEIFSTVPVTIESRKYQKSGLTKDKAEEIHNKVIDIMENDKPFTDSGLELKQLAEMIPATPNHLSQVINEERKQNFFDFVNWHRVQEAKRMIVDTEHQNKTLLSIAFTVGFNSKSAFNTAFKKHTMMTPSQFRKTAS